MGEITGRKSRGREILQKCGMRKTNMKRRERDITDNVCSSFPKRKERNHAIQYINIYRTFFIFFFRERQLTNQTLFSLLNYKIK